MSPFNIIFKSIEPIDIQKIAYLVIKNIAITVHTESIEYYRGISKLVNCGGVQDYSGPTLSSLARMWMSS